MGVDFVNAMHGEEYQSPAERRNAEHEGRRAVPVAVRPPEESAQIHATAADDLPGAADVHQVHLAASEFATDIVNRARQLLSK